MSKRIGLLTSGGDCAGLNAIIRAVVRRAEGYGWQVVGIREGTAGLLDRPVRAEEMSSGIFDGTILRMGGTILGTTNKNDPFAYPDGAGGTIDRSDDVVAGYRELKLDALIGIGGDGSMGILRKLAKKGGWNFVGIPKTIDNDVGSTEISIGHASAVNVAVNALDHLQPTAASHNRVMVLEVMGRDAGHIALSSGIAGGADVILIPEIPYRIEAVARHIERVRQGGRNFALVVVAEAVLTESGEPVRQRHASGGTSYGGIGHYIGDRIAATTESEVRVTVLGHVQRGGMPVSRDRLMASVFGVHAVDLIAQGSFDRMVAWQHRQAVDVPLEQAIEHFKAVEPDGALVRTARGLGISFGDG
ncbi:ATP-dependent 6-phosphofructokinase [Ferruginivarius sediminum]|uniref:ATP-dependent 6-phosphofructokinase n=1 Tax=Ferruginivarius sediminum TaxID=2661937 RepID=A0A369T902_9PROT|nr:ATP-dependent 6-phosphofructokinase [Ferruginivarius sediminum]RDD61770.1 ATP-dependent 6-phosphofructokinase [Ferruginivarius sediminum]